MEPKQFIFLFFGLSLTLAAPAPANETLNDLLAVLSQGTNNGGISGASGLGNMATQPIGQIVEMLRQQGKTITDIIPGIGDAQNGNSGSMTSWIPGLNYLQNIQSSIPTGLARSLSELATKPIGQILDVFRQNSRNNGGPTVGNMGELETKSINQILEMLKEQGSRQGQAVANMVPSLNSTAAAA